MRNIAICAVTVLLLGSSYIGLQVALEERITTGQEQDFRLFIPEHADGTALPTFKTRQGDNITIQIRSEVVGEANLHGYEKKIGVRPGKEVTLSVAAENAGMYPLHLHQIAESDADSQVVVHRHLATVEIHPQ